MRRRFGLALALATVSSSWLVGISVLSTRPAMAGGGVFSRSLSKEERLPSLAYERTLLIHDADAGREHFVRQLTFRDSKEPFGFVVPLPTRPEVAKVTGDPFDGLRARFPFIHRGPGVAEHRPPAAKNRDVGASDGSVQLLEQKQVGSFTAFVLAADEANALAGWLKERGLASSTETSRWLGQYVKRGYYYVAMLHEPRSDTGASAARFRSEVVRFSFDAPLPYYPYQEPGPAGGKVSAEPRAAEIWLVSQRASVPVALRATEGRRQWIRPFRAGRAFVRDVRANLESCLGAETSLLPPGDLVVQRFTDDKSSRVGFGDVLFVPKAPVSFDAAARKRLSPFLTVLDPSLADPSGTGAP